MIMVVIRYSRKNTGIYQEPKLILKKIPQSISFFCRFFGFSDSLEFKTEIFNLRLSYTLNCDTTVTVQLCLVMMK
jgi:hypothetical protein